MFRPMRRKKKDIGQEAAKQLLHSARSGVLAVNGDDGYPYAIPVNHFYDEERNCIYFHSAKVGHKVDALRQSDKVCFTVCGPETVKLEEEAWAPFVQSTVVFGRCHSIESREETIALVRRLAGKYYPNEAMIDEEIAASAVAMQIYVIEIEHMTGKEIQEK